MTESMIMPNQPLVAVYIVTYRRHVMLRRAIASVLAQTYPHIKLWIVNDDPADTKVAEIVDSFDDPRLAMFEPLERRGATRNFNLVFREREAAFAALLEDDNWWEPAYIDSQLAVLRAYPDAPVVVGNERIWVEETNNCFRDTGLNIWPFEEVQLHRFTLASICGSARICNSSMMVRVHRIDSLLTPDSIPVDVTEHFRERLLSPTIPLNGAVLVNYVETLSTARDEKGIQWGQYQTMLVGSAFAALAVPEARRLLARELWSEVGSPTSPRATSLLLTGFAIREARMLLRLAPLKAIVRVALTILRRPALLRGILQARTAKAKEWNFLVKSPLVRKLIGALK